MTLADSVAAIHEQGGLAVMPHPFMPTYFASCQPGMLRALIEKQPLDGIELAFAPPSTPGRRRALAQFYSEHSDRLGAAIGSSDCHFGAYDIGRVVTEFDGTSTADFREAVLGRRTQPLRRTSRSVPARMIARQQMRGLFGLPLRRFRGQLRRDGL